MLQDQFVVTTYQGLIDALRARRESLGMSQLDLDYSAGFQENYTSKLEAWQSTSGRGLGTLSLPLILGALGLELVVRPIPGPFVPRAATKRLRREEYTRRYLRQPDDPMPAGESLPVTAEG